MSQRNQVIVLGALVAVLGIVAYLELGRSSSPARNENATPAPARGTPATTSAPAPAAEAKPADSAQASGPGPSAADLRELADWFDVLRPIGAGIMKRDTPVFGMDLRTESAKPSELPVPETPGTTAQTTWVTEPGKLDGIIKVGNGPGKAIFEGELYQVGERVRGTTFTIVAVDDDSVTLKSDDRVIRRFWHD